MSLSKELKERGFINQTSTESLGEIFDGEKRVFYHGIDPTADSAHVGNLVAWLFLKYVIDAGHTVLFLVGGGTGMIGDPKPDAERQLKAVEEVAQNVQKIKAQAEKFFGGSVEFVDNSEWLGQLKLIDFLRDVGKHYTVNELIKKEAISTRLQSDTGLSYTEFAYPLLQGYDYYQLFQTKNCTVQVGGSDQWGNMISGVELVRRKAQAEVFAVTTPIVTDKSTGKKFGKSEGNAVWLAAEKTSPFQFYQFWLNVSDDSVIEYLKLYTMLSLPEIEEVRVVFDLNPSERSAQKQLAYQVTKLVHGEAAATKAQDVSGVLYGGTALSSLTEEEKSILRETAPTSVLTTTTNIVDVLVETGLAASKREARMFIESGAITLGGEKVLDIELMIELQDTSDIILLQRGKKQLHLLVAA